MKHRMLAAGSAILAFSVSLPAQTRPSQAWAPSKTPWGDPDIQGIYTSDDCIGTPMNRPASFGDRRYLTEEELAQRQSTIAKQADADKQQFVAENQRVTVNPPGHWGERARRPCRQTSLVIDPPNGQTPDLTPEAQARRGPRNGGGDALAAPGGPQGRGRAGARGAGFGGGFGANNDPANQPASWENFSYYIRCITRGVAGSILPVIYGNGTQIIQAPGYVTLLQEMVHEARVIPLDGRPHESPNIRSYMGDSRGQWEGKTLVVETSNFLPNKTGIGLNGGGVPTSDALKLTERFTKVDANTINYELSVDDPKTYARPFTVGFPITQEPGYTNFEYACHEGNYAMFDSLSGARAIEKAGVEKAAKKE